MCAYPNSWGFPLIFRLGLKLTLGQVVAKFKAKTKPKIEWQEGYYEHRIRPDENEENYAFYVFMNPYTENECGLYEQWKWWKRWKEVSYEFEELLKEDEPIPINWMKKEESIRAVLSVGS